MSLGRYDYDRRYQRRFLGGFLKFALAIAVVLAVGLFSYQMGVEQVKSHDESLRAGIETLSRQNEALKLSAGQMQTAAKAAETRARELDARLQREVPKGELAKLTQLVSERLAGGLDPARLTFVIQQTQTQRNCQPPETKRFVVQTPIVKVPNRSIIFANGLLTVFGEGQPSRNTRGEPEGWYDPAQPVTVRVTAQGGKEETATGLLPLHQSIVVDQTEHRFTFSAGQRSMIEVTADRCPFP